MLLPSSLLAYVPCYMTDDITTLQKIAALVQYPFLWDYCSFVIEVLQWRAGALG